MELAITWVVSLMLFFIVFSTASKGSEIPASENSASEQALFSQRVKSLFAAFDVISWGLFIGAICFLIAAVAQTIGIFS